MNMLLLFLLYALCDFDLFNCSYSDDTPLIRDEFLNETPIGPQDLGAEPVLGVAIEEHDSWSPSVPKEIVKSLKDKQVKRQEHIYEFIMTEKHHCQTLLVMQKVFVDSLQRHFSHLNLERMFPRLLDLTELHIGYEVLPLLPPLPPFSLSLSIYKFLLIIILFVL